MADIQYATNGKANAALTTGIIGTSLGAIASMGGLAGLLGLSPQNSDPNEKCVTRYEMGLIQENTLLKANQYADRKADALQMQIGQQAVWNATQQGVMALLQNQVTQLFTLTKLGIPATNVTIPADPAATPAT